jgi:glycosyltransferase involved in cell wall biosynthesis
MPAVAVSIVVCTHNGASRIRPTLEALANSEAGFSVEIVLVDNNSSDGTAEIAQRLWSEFGNRDFVFRIVHEAEPGQSFARRTGVRAACGDLIVFCDDDNWLNPDYLKIAVEVMKDPAIGAVGGQCEAGIEGPVPPFVYSHGHGYALGVQALAPGNVTQSRGYLWGAGLTARRADLLRLYDCPGFPVLPGRTGARLSAGDDSEICAGLVLLGRHLVYDDRLRLIHCIAPHRLTIEHLSQMHAGFKESDAGLRYYPVLRELRVRSPVANVLLNGLRWLRWMGSEAQKWRYRFAFLAAVRLPAAMTETEHAFYKIHRYLR